MPKVSVIIPSYNSEKTVPLTVESALAQTYKDIEVIVVDDGSTDGTRQALAPYMDRIRYIPQENKKHSGARNTGVKAAQGEYLAFLDSDDLWLPEKIERQVAVLDQHPDVVLVACVARYIDQEGNPARSSGRPVERYSGVVEEPSNWTRRLFLGDAVPGGGSSAMVRREALLQAGMFDEGLDYAEDWDTWMRVSFLGKFVLIPDALLLFRVSDWERKLRREASNELITRPLRLLEKASALWQGDPQELRELRAQGTAVLWRRAALASIQMGQLEQGREQYAKMLALSPAWAAPQKVLEMGLDRARLIYQEYDDMDRAEGYLRDYFAALPPAVEGCRGMLSQARGWLWYGRALDAAQDGDRGAARSYWLKAAFASGKMLSNRGFLSQGVEWFLGQTLAGWLRGHSKGSHA